MEHEVQWGPSAEEACTEGVGVSREGVTASWAEGRPGLSPPQWQEAKQERWGHREAQRDVARPVCLEVALYGESGHKWPSLQAEARKAARCPPAEQPPEEHT